MTFSTITLPAHADGQFRTDTTNAQLPWYQLKPGEFPPAGSEHRVRGELVEADYIHRTGQYRLEGSGELVNFTLLPYGCVYHLNAEADLRDVPLGTKLVFYLYQDEKGAFTKAAIVADEDAPPGAPAPATDAQKQAAEQQRQKHVAFIKQRGVAARIDAVDGKKLTFTFFGDPAATAALLKDSNIVPEQWAKDHSMVHCVVANEALRTYNPPVDNQQALIQEFKRVPTDVYGSSGMQWTVETRLLIEGFRKGRIIRVFFNWPMEDMPVGEGLYTERHDAKPEEESVNQYSYRTDFGNDNLPWYQLKPGAFPPYMSHHSVDGELLKIDPARRAGQFRTDQTGEIVDFTMPPFGYAQYLGADAELPELPTGTRYTFSLYQDEKGAFTRAAVITDEFTRMAGETLMWRVESVKPAEGKLFVANQLAQLKDDKEHLIRPPDLGHAEFAIGDATRVWKNDQRMKISDIAVGDELIINPTASTKMNRSGCADIWMGLDTHKQVTEKQRLKHMDFAKQNGLPGWIENVDGKRLTINFFAGSKRAFQDTMNGEPQMLVARLADDELHAGAEAGLPVRFKDHMSALDTAGTYGSAGVRWIVEADAAAIPDAYRPGRVVRVFRSEWPGAKAPAN